MLEVRHFCTGLSSYLGDILDEACSPFCTLQWQRIIGAEGGCITPLNTNRDKCFVYAGTNTLGSCRFPVTFPALFFKKTLDSDRVGAYHGYGLVRRLLFPSRDVA